MSVAQKLLKVLAWLGVAITGLTLAAYVVLLAVNLSDRPPSEAALRLEESYRSRSPIADEVNAYVYLMGFSVAKAENPREWGARRIAWAKAFVNRSQVDVGRDYPGEEFDFKRARSTEVRALAEACKSVDKGCLTTLENSGSSIAEWLATEKWRIDRYRTLLSHAGWLETVPFDLGVPVPSYTDVLDAQKLFFLRAWVLSGRGDVTSVRILLDEDMRFWRQVLESSDTLLTKMVAVAALTRNYTWSNIILRRLPADIAAHVVPRQWMTPFSDSERSMARCLMGEWLLFDSMIKRFKARGLDVPVTGPVRDEDTIGHYVVRQVLSPLFQPQDTSNRYAQLFAAIAESLDVPYEQYAKAVERVRALATHAAETNAIPHHMYNIIGNLIFAVSVPDFASYAVRVADLEGIRRTALLATELRSQYITSDLVGQHLRDAQDRNPYNGEPFLWDDAAGAIVFNGLEPGERGQHSFLY